MKRMDLIHQLSSLERRGISVFTRCDLEKVFPDEDEKTMGKSLQRMVGDGLLIKAARGVYAYGLASPEHQRWRIEEVAQALRPGKLCYLSLESMLSEYGVISQIPVDRLTVMTEGAGGIHKTPFGVIEFTYTKRVVPDILDRTFSVEGRPLRLAKKWAAVQDLRRVGRNVDMMDPDELADLNMEDAS